jgi:hypothetical protein
LFFTETASPSPRRRPVPLLFFERSDQEQVAVARLSFSGHRQNETMKALAWHGKGDIRCDTVPDPRIEDGREAIIKVTACAICGSKP